MSLNVISPCRPAIPADSNPVIDCLCETPAESVAFTLAAVAARVFIPWLTMPLLGIAAGVLATKLVLKLFDRYNVSLVGITKEACRFNKKYPKSQLIGFIFTLCMGWLSQTLGVIAGIILGSCGALVLDVESYKLIQQAKRKRI